MVARVCGMRQNTRTWMSRCVISSSAGAVSTNARRGLLVAWGEVASIEPQHLRSAEVAAPHIRLANIQLGKPRPLENKPLLS